MRNAEESGMSRGAEDTEEYGRGAAAGRPSRWRGLALALFGILLAEALVLGLRPLLRQKKTVPGPEERAPVQAEPGAVQEGQTPKQAEPGPISAAQPPAQEEEAPGQDEEIIRAGTEPRAPNLHPVWDPARAADWPEDGALRPEQLLEKWLTVEGLRFLDLEGFGCRQLLLVVAQAPDEAGTLCCCYTQNADGDYVPVPALSGMAGTVGKNGIRHERRRNTNTTPAGLYDISLAFGNAQPPEGLKIAWRQVTPETDWVCDENSIYFNTWQQRDDPALIPWSDDVEHLEDYPRQYAYACVINYNLPPDPVPDRGCAIFLHCSSGPTGGCVGLSREDMLAVLQWLDVEQRPMILITGAEAQDSG